MSCFGYREVYEEDGTISRVYEDGPGQETCSHDDCDNQENQENTQ